MEDKEKIMLIRLHSTALPHIKEVGSYEAEYKPAIGEQIALTLDADREQSTYPRTVRFRVVDVLPVAYNTSQTESWMHPYNEKRTELIIMVEPADDNASGYLTRLATAIK